MIETLKAEVAELWAGFGSGSLRKALGARYEEFLTDGCVVLENFLEASLVDQLAAEAREVYSAGSRFVSRESNGADERIYGVERIAPQFALVEQMRDVDEIAAAFYAPFPVKWFQLLGRITFTPNNSGSGSGWHRDSPFSHQFKALMYLSDVDESNGPFEYVKGSHCKRALKEITGFLGIPASQYRFSEEQIEKLEESGVIPPRTTITAKRGTLLLADTRGLHRGRPLKCGERLALTRYYFSRKVPRHFTDQYPLTTQV